MQPQTFFAAILVFVFLETLEVRTVFGFYPIGKSILPTVGLLVVFGAAALGIQALAAPSFVASVVLSLALLSLYGVGAWRLTLESLDILVFKELGKSFGAR